MSDALPELFVGFRVGLGIGLDILLALQRWHFVVIFILVTLVIGAGTSRSAAKFREVDSTKVTTTCEAKSCQFLFSFSHCIKLAPSKVATIGSK